MTALLRRLGDERGMALIMAIGMLAVLSIGATTLITYSSSNARNAGFQKGEDVSLDLAEAGVARALAKLAAAPQPTLPTLLAGETAYFPEGSVYYEGILIGETWNIISTSTVKNATGAADLKKTLKVQVQIGLDPNGNSAWNYLYADAPATRPCTDLINSVKIDAPLFIKGNLCVSNQAKARGSMVKVGGWVQTTQQGAIGDPDTLPATYVPELKVAGGCRFGTSGAFATPCNTSHRVWATTFGIDPGVLEKPLVDFQYWYTNAKPGPQQACDAGGSFPPLFDTNSVLDRPVRNVDIMPDYAYTCRVTSGPHLLGEISWTPDDGDADDYGNLKLYGTIFIDGNVDLTANKKGVYTGRGSIYASGKITFGTGRHLCGIVLCDVTLWDPEQSLLVFVGGQCLDVITSCDEPDQLTDGFAIGQSSIFQGAVYVLSDFRSTSTGQMQGPIIAHQLYFEQQGVANKWVALEAMTMGTPGGGRKLNIVSWSA